MSTKWTYHKERGFANYFFFENLIRVKKPLIKVDLIYQLPKYPISYFFESSWVLFEGVFSLWVSLTTLTCCHCHFDFVITNNTKKTELNSGETFI